MLHFLGELAGTELAPTIRCPTLFIRGDEESPEIYPAERFKKCAGGPCDVESYSTATTSMSAERRRSAN